MLLVAIYIFYKNTFNLYSFVSVNVELLSNKCATPKSAIFTTPLLDTSIFSGFKSRCTTLCKCTNYQY